MPLWFDRLTTNGSVQSQPELTGKITQMAVNLIPLIPLLRFQRRGNQHFYSPLWLYERAANPLKI